MRKKNGNSHFFSPLQVFIKIKNERWAELYFDRTRGIKKEIKDFGGTTLSKVMFELS